MLNSVNSEFDADQRMEIEEGISQGLDVSCYARKEFLAIQMRQIRLGLQEGLEVSKYASPEYDWFQMEEIRKGMRDGLDCSLYADPSYDYQKMRQIRKGLKQGIDLSGYAKLDAGILKELRKAVLGKVKIVDYIREGYNVEQLEQIRMALEKGLDIKPYLSREFRGASIREICKGLEEGLDPSIYADTEYGWQQMREIRRGMENRVDVSQYANSLFCWQQMREIRLGLEEGLDVSPYRRFMYTAADMAEIRKRISMEGLESILRNTEALVNPKLAVFLSSDEMEACIEIKCGAEEEVNSQEILDALRTEGIIKGILEDEITHIIEQKRYRQTIVVAKGLPAGRGADGWYEYFFETELDRSPLIMPDGSADYRQIRWYELVEEGQKIAFYHDAQYGAPGYTVTGKTINARKGKEKSVLTGKGFVLQPDGRTYLSALDGKIELIDNKKIEISRMCVLEEVTIATGNIDFDGCVYVKGNVGSGAVIHATEDVVVNGSVESATIKCGGEILLRQGANGAGSGLIQGGKKVTGNFFEAIKVVSGEDIYANYCLNCDLHAEGMIVISGSKGLIAGGVAQAVRGIKVYNVGNRARISTVLKMGVDDSIIQNKQDTEKKIADANRELVILGNAYMDFQRKYPPEVRNVMEMYLKIENAIYTKELQLDKLYKKKNKLDKSIEAVTGAKAVIAGVLYEGTVIIIDNCKWSSFNVQNVTVKRVNNRIVAYAN